MLSTQVNGEKADKIDGRGRSPGTRLFQFKKGHAPIPGSGRPKGSISMKEFAREYLIRLPPQEKVAFLNALPAELVFRMAEGNPHSTEDVRHTVAPTPIMDIVKVDSKVIDGALTVGDGARGAGQAAMNEASPAVDSGELHGVILDSGTPSTE